MLRGVLRALELVVAGIVGAVFATMIAVAWPGPTQAPPAGNVSPPINVGAADQIKSGGLGVDRLAVFGNAMLSGANRYLNFGTAAGESGYGIRDNAGTLQFKHSGGAWAPLIGSDALTALEGIDRGTLCGLAFGHKPASIGRAQMSYTSIAPCNGVNVGSSCPSGYTLRTVSLTPGAGAVQQANALRTCSKN